MKTGFSPEDISDYEKAQEIHRSLNRALQLEIARTEKRVKIATIIWYISTGWTLAFIIYQLINRV